MDTPVEHKKGELVRPYEEYSIVMAEPGFKQLSPIPTQDNIEDIYEEAYYDDHYPGWIQKTLDEQPYWELAFSDRYDVIERFVTQPDRSILDIGSFLGIFLGVGQQRGWTTLGVEPSTQAVRHAESKGIPTKQGLFEHFSNDELGQFDAVNLSLTLEHIANPIEVLQRAYELLKPGGIVCIEVPNEYSPLQEAVKRTQNAGDYWYAPPHHINYFDFDSLEKVLRHCNFNLVHKLSTFPMELFLLMGDNYLGNDEMGKACHTRRMTLETRLNQAGLNGFKTRLYEFFAQEGVGREAIVFGQKPA